jgi:hypothetical protein
MDGTSRMVDLTLFHLWLALIGLSIAGLIGQCYYFHSIRGAYICLLTMVPIAAAFLVLLNF